MVTAVARTAVRGYLVSGRPAFSRGRRLVGNAALAFAILGSVICSNNIAFGQGCSKPICSPNPTPCAHCIGTWTDNYGETWQLHSPGYPLAPGTQSITGTVKVPNPGCPTVTFAVSGTLTQTNGTVSNGIALTGGTTTFELDASDPSPPEPCGLYVPAPFKYLGSIANDGCDTASGTWQNSGGGPNGNFDMTKPTDVAGTESSTAVAWWSSYPTILLFQGNISSTYSLAGRQVMESPNGTPSDSCYKTGDPPSIVQYHLTGGG